MKRKPTSGWRREGEGGMKIVRYGYVSCRWAILILIVCAGFPVAGFAAGQAMPSQPPAEAFRDLPGVRPPADLPPEDDPPVCQQVFVERDFPFEPTRAPRTELRYRCEKDGVTFESDHLPRNRERIQRGLPW